MDYFSILIILIVCLLMIDIMLIYIVKALIGIVDENMQKLEGAILNPDAQRIRRANTIDKVAKLKEKNNVLERKS